MSGDFVWDDRRLILDDRAITSWSHLGEIFGHDFFYRSEDDLPYGYYRPLTSLSYLVDYSLWGLQPRGYHLTNVVLHATCSGLTGAVLLALGWSVAAATLAATLFAVHPIHTESVAWIAGRTDVLAYLFAALTLLSFVRQLRTSGQRRRWWAAAAAFTFALALLSKEMSILVVGWLALIAYFQPAGERATKRDFGPLLAIVVAYLGWRFLVLHIAMPGGVADPTRVLALRSAATTICRYLLWLIWPHPLNAYVINPYISSWLDPSLWLALTLLVFASLWVARAGSRADRLAGAMLLLSFPPVLNFVRLAGPADMGNIMAQRFCYFPSLPFVALVAVTIERWWQRLRGVRRSAVTALTVAVIVAMGARTAARNRDWRDELTFLQVTLAQEPNAVLLWRNLALHHLSQRNMAEAENAIRRLETLTPKSYAALSTRASYLVIANRVSEAIPLQEQIVHDSARGSVTALNNLAYLYRKSGRPQDALKILQRLVQSGGGYGDVYFNLAEICRERGDRECALKQLRLAYADRPNNRRIATALASVESESGNLRAAEDVYRQALRAYPGDPRLLNNLATVVHRRGDVAGALDLWRQAIARDPSYANARENYAAALAASQPSAP